MAEFPALPLLTDAYLGDTRHLTTIQHGAYLLMLIIAWRSPDCSLPNDDTYLARITGLDRRTWMNNKDTLLAFWRLNDQQKWVQGRLLDERNYVEQVRNKNALAGKASALKRKNRHATSVQPNANEKAALTPTPIDSGTKVPSSDTRAVKMPFKDIPPDWLAEAMTERGWPQNIVEDIWMNFRDYWTTGKGRNTKREQWRATWRNWYRKENIKTGVQHGSTAYQQHNQIRSNDRPTKDERAKAAVVAGVQAFRDSLAEGH